ncbi:MAG: 23S rRNA (uracil(1939)-C(5))-methyltransferase RlmD [Elusimicrobiota bacterium]
MKPACRHFGDCGGCRLQDIAYEDQLAKKAAELEKLYAVRGWTQPIPVHPSPETFYYRNKMEFSFQDVYPVPAVGEDRVLLGLKRKNRWDKVMNLEDCRLLSKETPELLAAVHGWARRENLDPYNLHKHTGFLRHLVVREGKNTGERMVLLVTTPGELPKESFVSAVRKVYPASTILHGLNSSKSDTAQAQQIQVLYGPGIIHESLLGRKFRVSPYSFMQTNTRGAEFLYGMIRDWLRGLGIKNLLDLYSGCGGIALSVAEACGQVMGVEIVESAVEDARFNAGLNKIGNAQFLAGKVEDFLPGLASQGLDVDAVVTDPSRAGLHPAAVSALKELSPLHVLYVSCNAKSQCEDIGRLQEIYDVIRVEAVDLFPHTDHVECVALLRRMY